MGFWRNQLSGPTDPITDAAWPAGPRKGFFTDTSICIGCKACEVACKEWNHVPPRPASQGGGDFTGTSYDNSEHLGAYTWRHVAFIEQGPVQLEKARASGAVLLGMPARTSPVDVGGQQAGLIATAGGARAGWGTTSASPAGAASTLVASDDPGRMFREESTASVWDLRSGGSVGDRPEPPGLPAVRWLMSSDVCKHCTHAGCLDVCPTGALFRSEFGSVVVQADVCNGCGYCVAACPFGVIGRREHGTVEIAGGRTEPVLNGGVAQKCTLCYDRLTEGQTPACAQTCPTTSISFGDHDEMVAKARARLATLHEQGHTEARLYGANPDDGVGGTGSVFLLMDEPEAYGLPPDPVVTTADLPRMFTLAGVAGTIMLGVVMAVFGGHGVREARPGSANPGRRPSRPRRSRRSNR